MEQCSVIAHLKQAGTDGSAVHTVLCAFGNFLGT